MQEKEKLVVTSNFSFSHNVFHSYTSSVGQYEALYGNGLSICCTMFMKLSHNVYLDNILFIFFSFQMHFKMSSAICFNLDQSKILSSGNGLICIFVAFEADFGGRLVSVSECHRSQIRQHVLLSLILIFTIHKRCQRLHWQWQS